MLSYYSILKFVSNSRTGEFISLGLVSVGYPQVFFKVSTDKLALAYGLHPEAKQCLREAFVQLQSFIPLDLHHQDSLVQFKNELDLGFLHNLSLFKEGCLQFSSLDFMDVPMDATLFHLYFRRYVETAHLEVVDFKKELAIKR